MTCNRSGSEIHSHLTHTEYEIYLSEGDVNEINTMIEIGAGASALAEAMSTWGILEASTPPGVGSAIAGVLIIERSLMNKVADGCGVKLNIYVTMVPVPTAGFHYWESQ